MQQTVTVAGEPVVDVQSVQTSTTFNQQLLQDIPAGRDPWSTVAQMPGVTLTTFDVGGNQSMQQSTMQVHGSTPGEQVFSFNGLDLNWPGANGGYTQFYTNHDSFEEFQVVADNAASAVSISGIYMNMVTKSGSNTLHGQAAALLRNRRHPGRPEAAHVQWRHGELRFTDFSRSRHHREPWWSDHERQVVAVRIVSPL